jgi:tRNA threonylcarbamoyladenosine biosynthesis protein TsaB
MRVLAIDTTSEDGGVAVYSQDECLAVALNDQPSSRYAVTLFSMAQRALAQARVGFPDIELYAVSNGPGSFTGIRVGVAAAQAWAKAFEKPVVGVTLLEALVEQARPETDWAVPLLDARRGEFFVAFFQRIPGSNGHAGRFEATGRGQIVRPDRLAASIEALTHGGQCRTFGGGSVSCLTRAHDLKSRSVRENLGMDLDAIDVPGALLEAIARLAIRACGKGTSTSPEELDACYIRRSDAEMNWRPAAKKVGS